MRGRWLGWIVLAAGAALAHAQEFSATGGVMGTGGDYDSSYAWELEFRHDLGRHAAWTINYLNEGHVCTHHRDGVAGQDFRNGFVDAAGDKRNGHWAFDILNVDTAAVTPPAGVPEPASLALLGIGALGLLRRKRA